MSDQPFDLVVIGGGPAGGSAVEVATARGARVALIERGQLGGTCLNAGCDPTKTMLRVARLLHMARNANRYGLEVGDVRAEWPRVLAYVTQVINTMRGGSDADARRSLAQSGVTVLRGEARFHDPHTLVVGDQTLRAKQVIIATGARPVAPPVEGLEQIGFITNWDVRGLLALPKRLAVIGGGPVGIEFAQIFQRLGAQVTVVEQGAQLLAGEEPELAERLGDKLAAEGVELRCGREVARVERAGRAKRLTLAPAEGAGDAAEERLDVDEILVATGFKPDLESLDLAAAGVAVDSSGAVQVDAQLRSSAPHIWAAGDAASRYKLTHVAEAQGQLAARNALGEAGEVFDDSIVPWAIYTDPSIAHVGRTAAELHEQGRSFRTLRLELGEVARAIIEESADGLVIAHLDPAGNILGAHALGHGADELLAPAVVAMCADLTIHDLGRTLFAYPTMAELWRKLAAQASTAAE